MRRTIFGFFAAVAILLGSCTSRAPEAPGTRPAAVADRWSRDPKIVAAAEVVALRSFPDCDGLLTYFRDNAKEHVNAYGFSGGIGFAVAEADVAVGAEARSVPAAAPGLAGAAGGFSTTNVQEVGVDEPDIVKTDGRRIFAMSGDRVMAATVAHGRARFAGTRRIESAWGAQLLLDGDRLLVIAGAGFFGGPVPLGVEDSVARAPGSAPAPGWRGRTGLHVLDVRNPSRMRVVRTLWVEGQYVSARMVDGIARVVIRTGGVDVALEYPRTGEPGEQKRIERENRRRIGATTLDDWLPRFTVGAGTTFPESRARPLVPCERVSRPREFSGLEMVSVLTVDPGDPKLGEAATVVGTGETVYASTTALYVTTNRWEEIEARRSGRRPISPKLTTQIHRFDISNPRAARYTSSGEVQGHLLNQWSLSEHDGRLRVATTLDPWQEKSVSQLSVLEVRGPLLARIGRVGGLGKTERIYAVRFIGALAYVVTFRQVDPLYVIDLSNPERPRVRGELKIPGFSAYLHPVDDGRLIGIGQDADLEGRALGVQATVFDVSDPDDPSAVDRLRFGLGHTSVQEDHRAFLWWGPSRLAVFPMWSYDERGNVPEIGAVAVRIDADGTLHRAGRVSHPRAEAPKPSGDGDAVAPEFSYERPAIERALVIGDSLFTMSQAGVMASDLDSLERRGWLEWPGPN